MSNVNTSAVIVLNETGQVLLLRRGKTAPWEPGKWSLPGGVIDPGETPEQAAIRETYEEVGIRINQIKKLKVIDSGEGWAVAFFICKDWSGTPELKETHGVLENDQMAWADKNELKRYRFVPTVSEALTNYFEGTKMEFTEDYVKQVIKEELEAILDEKKKKACKPAKGKRFAKRVNGKCRSFGQAGQAKGGGDRIRPGTKKGDAYCARSAKIKKCKNPPCANDLSRKKWKCRGSKSMK